MRQKSLPLFFLISILLLSSLGGCAGKKAALPVVAGGVRITGSDLVDLVSGKTLKMEEYGEAASLEMHQNGTLFAVKSPVEKNDGWWAVEEDRLCIKFKRWGLNRKVCYDVFRKGDVYQMYTDNGLNTSSFTVIGGAREGAQGAKRSAASGEPDVTVAASPVIQDTGKGEGAASADRDLRLIYRGMAQNCPGCNLPGVDLNGAGLVQANMAGANLRGANFSRANLKGANFKGADLKGANLSGANLTGANLADADLERADLSAANLERADLRGAKTKNAIGIDSSKALR